jgi:hypothetical protein
VDSTHGRQMMTAEAIEASGGGGKACRRSKTIKRHRSVFQVARKREREKETLKMRGRVQRKEGMRGEG